MTPIDLPLFSYFSHLDAEPAGEVLPPAVVDLPAGPDLIDAQEEPASQPAACTATASQIHDDHWQANPPDEADQSADHLAPIPTPPPGLPATLSEALAQVVAKALLPPPALAKLGSDLATAEKLCRGGDRNAAPLPCNPIELRPLLRAVRPARYKISGKRWSTIRSSIGRVLKLTGWIARNEVSLALLPDVWQRGLSVLSVAGQRAMIAALARYCTSRGLGPAEVTESIVADYFSARKTNTLEMYPENGMAPLVRGWNQMVRLDPAWPGKPLSMPPDRRRKRLPDGEYPSALLQEITVYLARLAAPDPFDREIRRLWQPATRRAMNDTLLLAATVLLKAGQPAGRLADLLKPGAVNRVLRHHLETVGDGKKWAPSAVTFAHHIKTAATHCADLTEAEKSETLELCSRVRGRGGIGLAERNLDRLAAFDDPQVLIDFFKLPWKLFQQAKAMMNENDKRPGDDERAAKLYRDGLALAIVQLKPLRRSDLARLDIEANFRRDTNRRFLSLVVPRTRKTGRPSEAPLSPELATALRIYGENFRPLIAVNTKALFPGRGGTQAMTPNTLGNRLTRLVEQDIGIDFNPHLVRHLVAMILLDSDPASAPVVQRVLDHTCARTSATFYGGIETRGAQRKYADALAGKLKADGRRHKK